MLGLREDGQWCAIALQMSLRGYGATFDEALAQLEEAIEAQVSFAERHDTVDRIFVPAEPQYFELYADPKCDALKREIPMPRLSSDTGWAFFRYTLPGGLSSKRQRNFTKGGGMTYDNVEGILTAESGAFVYRRRGCRRNIVRRESSGHERHYPIPYHGSSGYDRATIIAPGMLRDILRVLDLPHDLFD